MMMGDVVTKRALGILAVVPVFLAAFLVGGTASAAKPSPTPAGCSDSDPYPPPNQAQLETSSTSPRVGEQITVSGTGYCADEDVTITLRGKPVARAHTDASGAFSKPVVVRGKAGDAELCGIGASGLETDRDCLTLHVQPKAGANSAGMGRSAAETEGGGWSFTGAQVLLMTLLALGLLMLARLRRSVPKAAAARIGDEGSAEDR